MTMQILRSVQMCYVFCRFSNCLRVQITGGSIFLDVDVQNTPAFILTSASATSPGRLETGSLVLDNIKLTNVPFAVQTEEGAVILAGGTVTIDHWSRRSRLQEYADEGEFVRSQRVYKPPSLLDPLGNIFGRTRPVYANYGLDQIASVKDHGAKGDGVTDDTAALQRILNDVFFLSFLPFRASKTFFVFLSMQGAKLFISMLGRI